MVVRRNVILAIEEYASVVSIHVQVAIKLDASNVSNSTIVRVWVFAIAKGTV